MAVTDTKAVVDSQVHRDNVNTAENVVKNRALEAMHQEVYTGAIGATDTAFASLIGGKAATPVIQGKEFVIPPAPYPEYTQEQINAGNRALDKAFV
jgi:hypothetical protein